MFQALAEPHAKPLTPGLQRWIQQWPMRIGLVAWSNFSQRLTLPLHLVAHGVGLLVEWRSIAKRCRWGRGASAAHIKPHLSLWRSSGVPGSSCLTVPPLHPPTTQACAQALGARLCGRHAGPVWGAAPARWQLWGVAGGPVHCGHHVFPGQRARPRWWHAPCRQGMSCTAGIWHAGAGNDAAGVPRRCLPGHSSCAKPGQISLLGRPTVPCAFLTPCSWSWATYCPAACGCASKRRRGMPSFASATRGAATGCGPRAWTPTPCCAPWSESGRVVGLHQLFKGDCCVCTNCG